MSIVGRGIRNAFRNATRTVSIVLILGLAIGLAFVMLTVHRSVNAKASTALSSVGNTVMIGPPGYSAGGPLGKFLRTTELAPPRPPPRGHEPRRILQWRGEGQQPATGERDGHRFDAERPRPGS